MKKQFKWIWYAIWALICVVGGGGTLFSWMPRTPGMFYGGCAMLIVSVLAGVLMLCLAKGAPFKKAGIWALIAGAAYGVVLSLTVNLCDRVIFAGSYASYQPVHSSIIITVLNFTLAVALCVAMPKKYDPKLTWLKRGIALILCCVALVLSGLPQNFWWTQHHFWSKSLLRVAAPVGLSSYTQPEQSLVEGADLYVAVHGSDENDGSLAHPLATLERARDLVRAMDKTGKSGVTVAILAGEYSVGSLVFTEEDSGTAECPITYCAYGDGEVVLNAGVTLHPADFERVSGEVALRLDESVRDKVVCIDLTAQGVTLEQVGAMHAIGAYTTAGKYDGDYTGASNCELFVNDSRQTIARYPNEGWLRTGEVLEQGEPKETVDAPHIPVEGWDALRNPNGDTYALSQELADRINSWATLEDVWLYGYWSYDWAPGSTVIESFSYDDLSLKNKFVAIYAAHSDMPYYFYNVLEELDAPGEWYLDRTTGILYLYEPEDLANAEILLTLSPESLVVLEDADYLTFRGLTLCGSRGNGVEAEGDGNTVENCLIKNISGTGIRMVGYHNLISSNEITRTGVGGVYISGGDRETLTPGGNRVYNNHIHHWGELSGVHGIQVRGVGQLIDHNELHDYIDVAINYMGNDHVIEYNLIYDMSLESSDSSAIYNGRSWTDYGCIVRYNAIYNMGDPGFSRPNGIYLDDGLAGQQVYGNLLVNVPQNGIKIGGGRDNEVWGNVIINTTENAIYGLRPLLYAGSFATDVFNTMLPNLEASPWQSDIWQAAYPQMQDLFWDLDRQDDPNFWGAAANNTVTGNLVVNREGSLGEMAEEFTRYSYVENNAVYKLNQMKAIFVDPDNGDYRLREDSIVYELIPDFADLPIDRMGRE